MAIWEPKPPGTLWATPGLLRESYVQEQCYISSWIGTVLLHYKAFFQILAHQAQPASYMAD